MLLLIARLVLPFYQPGLRVGTLEVLVEKVDKVSETKVAVAQMPFNPSFLLIVNRSSHVRGEVNAAETTALELMLHGSALFFH